MKKIKKGDVFVFKYNDRKFVVGQIIRKMEHHIVVIIFKDLIDKNKLNDINIDKLTPILIANTFESKLEKGDWVIVSNKSVKNKFEKSRYYKVGMNGRKTLLINEKNEIIRELKKDEEDNYCYEKYVSPVRLEKAIRAFIDKDAWKESYNCLLISKYY